MPYEDQPVPVARVQPDVWAGHAVQDVTEPPGLNTAPLHCVHVELAPEPLTIEPGAASNAVDTDAVPHVDADDAVWVSTPAVQ